MEKQTKRKTWCLNSASMFNPISWRILIELMRPLNQFHEVSSSIHPTDVSFAFPMWPPPGWEEDAVWMKISAGKSLGFIWMLRKNGYQKEGEEAVTTFGVKHRLWHMDTLGVPQVTETLGVYRRRSCRRTVLSPGESMKDAGPASTALLAA